MVVQPDEMVAVEKYGDVDHQSKKAKVDGMRSVIDKNRVDAIMLQISVMRGLEEIYIGRMGRDECERRLFQSCKSDARNDGADTTRR